MPLPVLLKLARDAHLNLRSQEQAKADGRYGPYFNCFKGMFHKYQEQGIFFCAPHKIFQTVIDVEKYPDFVPWCKAVYIKEKANYQMIVDLLAVFYGIKGKYTSEVTATPPDETNEGWIRVESSNGIFKHLYNEWQFIPIDEKQTMVKFYIEFKFKSSAFSMLLNSVYKHTQSKIITAFKNRAEQEKVILT